MEQEQLEKIREKVKKGLSTFGEMYLEKHGEYPSEQVTKAFVSGMVSGFLAVHTCNECTSFVFDEIIESLNEAYDNEEEGN